MHKVDRRKAFTAANGIVKLEGWEPSPADLALQERVIRGELTFDEAVREVIDTTPSTVAPAKAHKR